MAVNVTRIYVEGSEQDLPEDFLFSIVADESTAKYVFAKDEEISGLDDERISDMKNILWKDETPSTPEDWANIALYRVNGQFFDGPEYSTLDDAVSKETEELNKSKELRDDLNNEEGFEMTDDELLVDDEEK